MQWLIVAGNEEGCRTCISLDVGRSKYGELLDDLHF